MNIIAFYKEINDWIESTTRHKIEDFFDCKLLFIFFYTCLMLLFLFSNCASHIENIARIANAV